MTSSAVPTRPALDALESLTADPRGAVLEARTTWRRLPPAGRDAGRAAAFVVVWFSAYEFGLSHGWYPVSRSTYVTAGVAAAVVLLLGGRRAGISLVLSVAVYPFVFHQQVQWGSINLESRWPVNVLHLLSIFFAGHLAASWGRMRTGWVLAGSAAAVTLMYISPPMLVIYARGSWFPVWGVDEAPTYWWHPVELLSALVIGTSAVLLGAASRRQRADATILIQRNAEVERLRHLEAAEMVAQERVRIARELHDVVAHHVSAVVIRAQAAGRVADVNPGEPLDAVRWIAADGQAAMAAMRHVVRVLRTPGEGGEGGELAPQVTLAALPAMAERMGAAGLRVDLDVDAVPALPAPLELAATRIVQEALTNVLVHAHASRAAVSVHFRDGVLTLQIEDDGDGVPGADGVMDDGVVDAGVLDAGARRGNGVIGMTERAVSCGGRLDLGVATLGGWRVTARLPVSPTPTPTAAMAVR